MTDSARPRIAISLGDPAGIGPEIVARAMAHSAMREAADYIILGHAITLQAGANTAGIDLHLSERGIDICEPVLPINASPPFGQWTAETGQISLDCVETGIALCLERKADALVTGPICKAAWKAAGAPWPGHTELLAERTGTDNFVMMLAGEKLRVALATIHEPLQRVPKLISTDRLVAIATVLDRDLRARFRFPRPHIAVLGLNPHAGEDGHMGREELEIIAPAVKAMQQRGIHATGPLPADTAFHHARRGAFDAVLAMYHDQGLAPLKTVAFDTGVNITLGLPILRTSVDHGTAFDIAGTGTASAASCIAAIETAIQLASNVQ